MYATALGARYTSGTAGGYEFNREYMVADFGSIDISGVTFAISGPNADKFIAPYARGSKVYIKALPGFIIRVAGKDINFDTGWLAEQGITTSLEAEGAESALSAAGRNGLPLWQSYCLGLDTAESVYCSAASVQPATPGNIKLTANIRPPDSGVAVCAKLPYPLARRAGSAIGGIIDAALPIPPRPPQSTPPVSGGELMRVSCRMLPISNVDCSIFQFPIGNWHWQLATFPHWQL